MTSVICLPGGVTESGCGQSVPQTMRSALAAISAWASGVASGIIGSEFRSAIGAGDLHIGLARLHQLQEIAQSPAARRRARPARRRNDRTRRARARSATRSLIAEIIGSDREQLHVPAARLDAFDGSREARPADVRIIDAAGREIETDAAEAVLVHRVEVAFRRLVVDHGDAARGRRRAPSCRTASTNYPARRCSASRSPRARYAAPCAGRHFFGRCQFRRIDAAGEERKLFGIAVDMGVAVAGAGGNFEIHRRRGLRCFGKMRFVLFMVTPAAMEASIILRRVSLSSPLLSCLIEA